MTNNNILYLINYGKIANHSTKPKENLIDKNELKAYYDITLKTQKHLESPLSFANYKEAQTTKHIHRLHPYKGKFIPQLVEYFLDSHTDSLKKEVFFAKKDIVLDPFCGSGTTLCVANELEIHSVGVEISCFNTILANAKVKQYDNVKLKSYIDKLTKLLESKQSRILEFEKQLNEALSDFNQAHFPSKSFKRKIALKQIDEKAYSVAKEKEFLTIYEKLVKKFKINLHTETQGNFLKNGILIL